jgi:hypothetical protein
VMLLLAALLSTAYSIIMYPPWRLSRDTLLSTAYCIHYYYVPVMEASIKGYIAIYSVRNIPFLLCFSHYERYDSRSCACWPSCNLFVACSTSSPLNQSNKIINSSLLYSTVINAFIFVSGFSFINCSIAEQYSHTLS